MSEIKKGHSTRHKYSEWPLTNKETMKNYVVGILSMFDHDLKLFKIEAENEYEAFKKAMVQFASLHGSEESEKDFQKSNDYPKNLDELEDFCANSDLCFSTIEISEF